MPATHEAAKRALAECSSIDECQQWADKAEAMASYAKQAKDESLRKMADRIQARAIRRCGELLKQIPTAQGARTDIQPGDGADTKLFAQRAASTASALSSAPAPQVTRTSAAAAAGLSERQKVTALRVASVPAESFNAQVESDSPPTVTKLAEQGKKPLVDLGGRNPADFAKATQALGTLRRFAEFCQQNNPVDIAKGVFPAEVVLVLFPVGGREAIEVDSC